MLDLPLLVIDLTRVHTDHPSVSASIISRAIFTHTHIVTLVVFIIALRTAAITI